MKLFSVLVLLLTIPFSISAQQSKIDSLKIEFIKTNIDTTKARILHEIVSASTKVSLDLAKKNNDSLMAFSKGKNTKHLAYAYRMKGAISLMEEDYDTSIEYYQKSLKLYGELKNRKGEAKLLDAIGTYYARKKDNDKAREYYEKSIFLNEKINNEEDNIITLISLSQIDGIQKNDHKVALEYLIKALEIADKFKSDKAGQIHERVAASYLILDSYSKGKYHLEEALKFAEKNKDLDLLANVYQSLGYLYEVKDEDYEKALYYYKKALDYSILLGSKYELINHYYNVAQQYSRLKNPKEAEVHFKKGLDLGKEINQKTKIISGNYFLANFYADYKNINKAKEHLNYATKLLGNDSKEYYKNHYYRLGISFSKSKEYKEAFKNMQIYSILADSLFKKNSVDQLAEIETKYQTEKKEKENLKLKAENTEQELLTQKANNLKWLFGLSLLGVSLIAFFIWKRYQSEAKAKAVITQQKNNIETQKNTIENLQKELHHRVKNNLAIIDTFIEVAKEEFNNEKFNSKLTEIQNRVSSINEIHKQLYQSSDVTNLNIKKYIDILSKNVAQSFTNKEINIRNHTENIKLNADTSFPVGLIINEFLTNSFKYAFEKKGTINIEMKDEGKNYILSLSDNGKGLPDNFDIEQIESFGLRIVKLLTKQIDGVFNLESNNGVQLTIHIPKLKLN
jgi:two-component sensor histidine kinase/tetratricopeptide (TPR) repeat protein